MPLTVHATRTLAGRGGGGIGGIGRITLQLSCALLEPRSGHTSWKLAGKFQGLVMDLTDVCSQVEAHSRRYLIFTLKLN